jgi:hypothetical protein
MKIDLTAGDVQKAAGNSLRTKAKAEKFLKANKAKIAAAIMEAAKEVLEDWVFEHEIDEITVDDADTEDDDECDE